MTHNFTKLNLLRNKNFYFVNTVGKKIYFTVPTLDDYITNDTVLEFFSLLQVPLEQFSTTDAPIHNKLEFLLQLLKTELYIETVVTTIHKFMPQVKVHSDGIFIDDYAFTVQEFEWLLESWLISIGIKGFEEEVEKEDDSLLSDMDRKMRAGEEKIKRIKKQQQNTKETNFSIDNVLAAVMKEFRLTMNELLTMNLYSIFWYYSMALRYNNYRIETIAYGNGLIKQHKYFIE